MSKMVQMRVNDSEWAVISLGASQRQMTMTGFIKEAVHFYLSNAPSAEAPKKDRFDLLLEMLDKGPKFTPTEEQSKRFSEVKKEVENGTAKMITIDEARAMVKKAMERTEKKEKQER